MKTRIIVALALLVSATSASFAWAPHHHRGHLYNFAPYHQKGGPGPRVLDGRGMGAGAESGTAR
jgi:hypothetical protein